MDNKNSIINTDTITGLERGRAEFAYRCALEGSRLTRKSEYRSYVKAIPMYIKTNGLGATFAFVESKKDDNADKAGYAYKKIYEQTTEWLKIDDKGLISLEEGSDLSSEIIRLESPNYRAVTIEVLSFFNWLRRFAEGLIENEGN